ncbi:MAG: hypothetical protein EOT05_03240 [Candidatus Microsaccharimonas sossegonensis]|uniref:Uncharacterized protein n=1 Tax=Candidatus Microsaccharimonas sossegonensis TaxID=2506948 RepID=A0A4V1J7H8_9BACT|nr:MAG: hypothetical protein EOT05_03240 [Candidatus Microsaccharimonas sossegonensis]
MKHKKRSPAFPLIPNNSEYCIIGDKKKRKYETEMDAALSAPSKDLHQYICVFCGHWHNGSSTLLTKKKSY